MQPLPSRPDLLQEAITLLGLVSVGRSSQWMKARDRFAVKAGRALDGAANAPEGNNELPTATTARM